MVYLLAQARTPLTGPYLLMTGPIAVGFARRRADPGVKPLALKQIDQNNLQNQRSAILATTDRGKR